MRSHPGIEALAADPAFPRHLQMSAWERFALLELLRKLRPEVSIEIGTYQGGSLQMLSHFSHAVISIDRDPTVSERLRDQFPNVEFHCGLSHKVFPEALRRCDDAGRNVEFILIDGDHSCDGVRGDIEVLLEYLPKKRCVVIIHDSFNPECREGLLTANWSTSPAVQAVELDFIPGIYHHEAHDTAAARTMWGGFACAVLDATPRAQPVAVHASQQAVFDAVYRVSAYAESKKSEQRFRRIPNGVRSVWARYLKSRAFARS